MRRLRSCCLRALSLLTLSAELTNRSKSLGRVLAIAPHQFVERRPARRKLLERNAVERRFRGAVQIVKFGAVRFIDVDQPGHVFVLLELVLDVVVRGAAIRRDRKSGRACAAPRGCRRAGSPASPRRRHSPPRSPAPRGTKSASTAGMVVLAREGIALGRALMIVEGHAGREHVDRARSHCAAGRPGSAARAAPCRRRSCARRRSRPASAPAAPDRWAARN